MEKLKKAATRRSWLVKTKGNGAAEISRLIKGGVWELHLFGVGVDPREFEDRKDDFRKEMASAGAPRWGIQVWPLCWEMKKGDRIVMLAEKNSPLIPVKPERGSNIVAKGTLLGGFSMVKSKDSKTQKDSVIYSITVAWEDFTGIAAEGSGLETEMVYDITENSTLLAQIGESIDEDKAEITDESSSLHPIDKFKKKWPLNRILCGPPGTGKTYNTVNEAVKSCNSMNDAWVAPSLKGKEERQKWINQYQELIKEGRIEFITFHQSYDYSDFVQGIRPREQSGAMSFEFFKGPLRRIADAAAASYRSESGPVPYVLIIDEINRGNVSKIFGELITLIEEDKRGVSGHAVGMSARLLYEKSDAPRFYLPPNLYILGTLNTADRSVQRLDSAMRRRFDFEDFMPQPEILGGRLEAFLSELNARLLKALSDPGSLIGHAWFMDSEGSPIANDDELARVLNNKVIPLLGEWFWDQPESLKLVLGEGALKLVREKGGLLQRRMAGGEVELFLKSFASKGS